MKNDIEKVLLSEEEIQKKVKELGAQLTEEYQGSFSLGYWCFKRSYAFYGGFIKTNRYLS